MGTTFACNDVDIISIPENLHFHVGEEITIEIRVDNKEKWIEGITNECKDYKIIKIEHRIQALYSDRVSTIYSSFVHLEELFDYNN